MPFEPVLLANIDKPDSHTLRVYEKTGGYQALRKVLKEMTPADVIEWSKRAACAAAAGPAFPPG
jgi:NADH-quinone oxidoreductase subunit F